MLGGVTPVTSARVTSSADPTQDPSDPEYGVQLPAGLRLERPESGGVRLELRSSAVSRALSALPRMLLVGAMAFGLLQAVRHHVFIFFWFLGLPFLAWLRGPARHSVLVGERTLEVEATQRMGRTLVLPRSQIARIEIVRGGLFQLYQRALFMTLVDGRTAPLFVGISAVQAEFVNGGLQRWLASAD